MLCVSWTAFQGGSNEGLMLGDTVGRSPGAYGFVVSCDLSGLGAGDVILGAKLVCAMPPPHVSRLTAS